MVGFAFILGIAIIVMSISIFMLIPELRTIKKQLRVYKHDSWHDKLEINRIFDKFDDARMFIVIYVITLILFIITGVGSLLSFTFPISTYTKTGYVYSDDKRTVERVTYKCYSFFLNGTECSPIDSKVVWRSDD